MDQSAATTQNPYYPAIDKLNRYKEKNILWIHND